MPLFGVSLISHMFSRRDPTEKSKQNFLQMDANFLGREKFEFGPNKHKWPKNGSNVDEARVTVGLIFGRLQRGKASFPCSYLALARSKCFLRPLNKYGRAQNFAGRETNYFLFFWPRWQFAFTHFCRHKVLAVFLLFEKICFEDLIKFRREWFYAFRVKWRGFRS